MVFRMHFYYFHMRAFGVVLREISILPIWVTISQFQAQYLAGQHTKVSQWMFSPLISLPCSVLVLAQGFTFASRDFGSGAVSITSD